MTAVFLQTLPFFALVALGFGAAQRGFFSPDATAALTKFVFYFALSALIFRFAAGLTLGEIMNWTLIKAYLSAGVAVYLLVTLVAVLRRLSLAEIAVEGQCGVVGNLGFLGIPLLATLLGEGAIGPLLLMLSVDFLIFGNLLVILVTISRESRVSYRLAGVVAGGLVRNPMVMSLVLGLAWASTEWELPEPVLSFLTILGAAATPGALFAIGASLAGKSAERPSVALWLSFAKLLLFPAATFVAGTMIFALEPGPLTAMVTAAALPVAGNIFILAQHYGAAPKRVSAAILVSTAVSVVTLPAFIAWLSV